LITLACPVCRATLQVIGDSGRCAACGYNSTKRNGVWQLLRPERVDPTDSFLADYTKIRLAEGRGSADAAFYRNLPDCPDDHPMAWQWGIRRRTFSCFRDRVLPSMGAGLRILDLGAGTGWLSNRLAQLGHQPCAVDLSCNDQDGLEAARHFGSAWPRVRAEFDHLPFSDASVDAVVFNASLHYSADYVTTLQEALRVLTPEGSLVVLETPVYKLASSGRRMVEERHAAFLKRYGTRSDSMPSIEFLTWSRIEELGAQLCLEWKIVRPWYGIQWALRPWIARLKKKREPSRFPILIARRSGARSQGRARQAK
jgi:SAM-dependent methyltransferase